MAKLIDYRINSNYYLYEYSDTEYEGEDYPDEPDIVEKRFELEDTGVLVTNSSLYNFTSEESLPSNLGLEFKNDDAAWVMSCCFLIFTMQTGFGLYEAGNGATIGPLTSILSMAISGLFF